ncbi:helix-turn-helix transcriptional regulator [Mycobacteroides abscessus]|uniref:helix-turn-helix transcriptional regulator n=1 Tax=Mycobacteroides abscessus TaxID=36809 RepID=UPI0005E5D87C|nr:helix-turn-helix domain-containing protein [Mycobacteroides abscessus]CPW94819.1 Helix-turn-helix domain [Mycobacteroides abscessus]
MSTDILTSAEAAMLLGITPETLAAWRHRGKSPKYTRTGHRTVTYDRADIEAFISEREGSTPTLAQLARRVAVLEKRLARIER